MADTPILLATTALGTAPEPTSAPIPLPASAFLTIARTLPSALIDLAAERYRRESAGVAFLGAAIATDPASQAKLSAAYTMAAAGHWQDGAPWKAADGSFVALTSAQVQALAIKAALYVGGCYAREAVLAAALTASLDTDITAGWPSGA